MTALIAVNSIAAAIVVLGLAVAMRLGHLTAGHRFEPALRRLELHRGGADATRQADQQGIRRAA